MTRDPPLPIVRALPFVLGLGGVALVGTSALLRAPCLPESCPSLAAVRTAAVVLAGATAGVGGGWAAYLAVEEWTVTALAHPLGRLLFAPSRATLVGVGVVWTLGVVLARPLFSGALGVGEAAWLVLAVPYYPFLVVAGVATAVLWHFDVTVLYDRFGGPRGYLVLVVLVVAAWLVVAAQTVWLYLIGFVVARVGEAGYRVVIRAESVTSSGS